MKKLNLFLLVFFFISCKEKKNCSNAKLSNKIIVKGFNSLTKKKIKLYKFKTQTKSFENININKIHYQNNKDVSGYGETNIIVNESLFSKENYRLIINDTNYDITNIKILSEVRMYGMREDSVCYIKSFKINKKEANQIYNTSILTFNKPE